MAWLSFVDIYSNYSLGHKKLKITEWTDPIGVVRVVVVDIPGAIDIEHIVSITGIRGFYFRNLTNSTDNLNNSLFILFINSNAEPC